MNPDNNRRSFATTAITAAVGAGVLGGALYMLLNGNQAASGHSADPLQDQTIHIVTNSDECQRVVRMLREHCKEFRVLGLDCEWVHYRGPNGRSLVALLQLSSHQGLCALIRLCEMRSIPRALVDLLSDPAIVKVGVDPIEDAKLLMNDYGLKVNSTLDLRFMAKRCGLSGGLALAQLAEKSLGVQLDKDWQIRGSDWEADELTERQIKYAANDAHVAVELFRTYAEQIIPCSSWTNRQTWITNVITEFKHQFDKKFVNTQLTMFEW